MLKPSARDDGQAWTAGERRSCLEAMFREYGPRILDYARHRGATLVEAEDIVSEVFIVLARRLDDSPAEVLPWLYGVARKVMGNQVRSKRRRLALKQRIEEQVAWACPAVPDPPSTSARDVLIQRALARLPAKEREALLLVAWDELSYEEAARSLGCTRPAFAQLVYRARRRLLALLGDIRTYRNAERTSSELEEL